MDSSSNNNNNSSSSSSHIFHHQQQQPSSGLLRFRSAPSSFLANFNDNGSNNSNNSLLGFPDFDDKSAEFANFTNSSHSFSGLPPHYPRNTTSSSAMDGSFGLIGSVAMGSENQPKPVDSSLSRQNSSPPGLLVQNGYASMKGMSSYIGAIRTNNGELSPRLKTQLSFSSRSPSSLGMLDEIETETIVDSGKLGSGSNGGRFYGSGGFPYNCWNDSTFSGSFNGLKMDPNDPAKLFSNSQNGEVGNRVQLLSHHLSLPKVSVDMGAVEKFLQYPDSVPCKIRAKRGCATHPRSIAERIRRTRISERMKKLQELVPNMEKQTNTADMLDFAVDYIKDLQKQYTILRNSRANCKCSSKLKSGQNQVV